MNNRQRWAAPAYRPLTHLEVTACRCGYSDLHGSEPRGRQYENDIVIEGGRVRKRKKEPSKPYCDEFGHTPLSADEAPWGGGPLNTAPALRFATDHAQVLEEARRRSIDLTALPTQDACRLITDLDRDEVYSVLKITC
jgi:hypothetical protein